MGHRLLSVGSASLNVLKVPHRGVPEARQGPQLPPVAFLLAPVAP